MVGWHHLLDGHGCGWTPGVGDGQGGLVCCGSWGRKELDTTEWLNWTDSVFFFFLFSVWIEKRKGRECMKSEYLQHPKILLLFTVCHNWNLSVSYNIWKEKVLVAQFCPTLCNPTDFSSPGSSVHGIVQARLLEWVAITFSRGSSQPRNPTIYGLL